MKLQPESKKELTRIACGTAICTAVMWVIFAALHLVGWVKFDYTVVLGSLIGAAVGFGNFVGICLVAAHGRPVVRLEGPLDLEYSLRGL